MLVSLDIQKSWGGEYWTNRYILDVVDIPSGVTVADSIVGWEKDITLNIIEFVSYRLSDMIPGTDSYLVVPLTGFGERSVASQGLPLFNVLRVDFGVGLGRPSRKYLRGVLVESDQSALGQLETASITEFAAAYVAPLVAITQYVDVDGQPIISGAVHPKVGMRQLRRGSKRKLEPVIPTT
jgi:hypothetical protein